MPYELLLQRPETPIGERWAWKTNVLLADTGEEQRISTYEEPKRSWTGSFAFDNEADLRRHLATMFSKFRNTFSLPLFHMSVKLKAKTAVSATVLYCNTARSDFRVGQTALIEDGSTFETFVIDSVDIDSIESATPLLNAYSKRATIAPVTTAFSSDNATVARRPVNSAATASFNFFESTFLVPFIEELDKVALTTFATYPVLDRRGQGSQFEQALMTGLEVIDHGGLPSFRASWSAPKLGFPLTFKSPRGLDPSDWNWWRTFADYCKGSTNPFFLPTWRSDFEVFTPAVAAGTQVTLEGTEYSENYYPISSFRRIMFLSESGAQHFATVTAVALVSGNDRLTFTPALPAGTWAGQTVGLLLKCRIGDDTFQLSHEGMDSFITLNIRTVD